MKIPKNMTEKQVMDKIELVIGRIAPRYVFPGYDINDIKQESFIICLDALKRYDKNRPLENFLSVHLSNRLKNFVRDNNFTKSDEEKKKVLLPMQLCNEYTIEDDTEERSLDQQEIFDIVDCTISTEYRSDYLKMVNGVHVSKKRREEIIEHIKDILKEKGIKHG